MDKKERFSNSRNRQSFNTDLSIDKKNVHPKEESSIGSFSNDVGAGTKKNKAGAKLDTMVFYFSDRFSPEHGPIFGKLFMQSLDVSLIEVSLFTNLSLLYFSPPFSTKIVPLPVRIIPFLIGSNCFRSLFSLSLFLFFFLSFHSIFTSPNSDASFHEFSIGRFTAVE